MATAPSSSSGKAPTAAAGDGSFLIQCLGQIVGADMDNHDYLYCRYLFSYGPDWEIIAGIDSGLSQTSCKNNLNTESGVIWNFPIDVSFKSTNIHGWPRMAISVYGIDYFGRDVIRGYGSALIPLQPGHHNIVVDMFAPVANSAVNEWASWLMGTPAEVSDQFC